jgi:hypothetical protein
LITGPKCDIFSKHPKGPFGNKKLGLKTEILQLLAKILIEIYLCHGVTNTSHNVTTTYYNGRILLASDEAALISFLVAHKAEAGDGFNFKNPIWKATALHMVAYTEKGDPKIASACKNKWG